MNGALPIATQSQKKPHWRLSALFRTAELRSGIQVETWPVFETGQVFPDQLLLNLGPDLIVQRRRIAHIVDAMAALHDLSRRVRNRRIDVLLV